MVKQTFKTPFRTRDHKQKIARTPITCPPTLNSCVRHLARIELDEKFPSTEYHLGICSNALVDLVAPRDCSLRIQKQKIRQQYFVSQKIRLRPPAVAVHVLRPAVVPKRDRADEPDLPAVPQPIYPAVRSLSAGEEIVELSDGARVDSEPFDNGTIALFPL